MKKLIVISMFLIGTPSFAENVKTVKLCEKNVANISVSTKGSVLDFPAEPEKIVLGTKNSFSIEYIRNDLAISPTSSNSKSNLFVYLQGRRFVLNLGTSPNGVTLYFIKDCDSDRSVVKKNGR